MNFNLRKILKCSMCILIGTFSFPALIIGLFAIVCYPLTFLLELAGHDSPFVNDPTPGLIVIGWFCFLLGGFLGFLYYKMEIEE